MEYVDPGLVRVPRRLQSQGEVACANRAGTFDDGIVAHLLQL
jgi:hypothetical protein